MTTTQLNLAVTEAPNYSDPGAFVSDMLLSSAFLPPEDDTAEIDTALAPQLRAVWAAVNAPFSDFLSALGLTQTELSRRYSIPLRTVQHWAAGDRECPVYVRLMLARLCGLIEELDEETEAKTETAIVDLHNHYAELGSDALDRMDANDPKAGDDWEKALEAMRAIDETCKAFGYKLVYDCPELGVGTYIIGIEKEG